MSFQSKSDNKAMCRIVEEIVEKEVAAAKAESAANNKREDVINLLESTKMSPEEISRILKIDRTIVDELSAQIIS